MDAAERGADPARHPARMSDEDLVRLWRAHRRWIAAVVYAHKPADIDMEDLLQEVAVKLVRNIHHLRDHESIRPWLRTVAVNAARSAGRKTRSKNNAQTALETEHRADRTANGGMPIDQPGLQRSVEDAQARGRRALELAQSLPLHYREPLLLSLRGLSQKEIATAMDVPVTTIETRLIRARKMVERELRAEDAIGTRSTPGTRMNDAQTVGSQP